jgi:DNA-directed RNA polymerase subunit RPC12/RpoP
VTTRYRCSACGNLTRFDVTSTKKTRAFHHFTIGGDLVVEDEEVLEETVHEVACRWCGHGRAVEEIDAAGVSDSIEPAGPSTR